MSAIASERASGRPTDRNGVERRPRPAVVSMPDDRIRVEGGASTSRPPSLSRSTSARSRGPAKPLEIIRSSKAGRSPRGCGVAHRARRRASRRHVAPAVAIDVGDSIANGVRPVAAETAPPERSPEAKASIRSDTSDRAVERTRRPRCRGRRLRRDRRERRERVVRLGRDRTSCEIRRTEHRLRRSQEEAISSSHHAVDRGDRVAVKVEIGRRLSSLRKIADLPSSEVGSAAPSLSQFDRRRTPAVDREQVEIAVAVQVAASVTPTSRRRECPAPLCETRTAAPSFSYHATSELAPEADSSRRRRRRPRPRRTPSAPAGRPHRDVPGPARRVGSVVLVPVDRVVVLRPRACRYPVPVVRGRSAQAFSTCRSDDPLGERGRAPPSLVV